MNVSDHWHFIQVIPSKDTETLNSGPPSRHEASISPVLLDAWMQDSLSKDDKDLGFGFGRLIQYGKLHSAAISHAKENLLKLDQSLTCIKLRRAVSKLP